MKNNPERTKKLNEEGKLKDVKEMMNSTLGSGSGGKIKYGAHPDIRGVEKEWKAYIDLFEKYVNTTQEINDLIEAKAKKEAFDLWENI